MKRFEILATVIIGVVCLALGAVVSADDKDKAPAAGTIYSFWAMPKQANQIIVLAQGTEEPKTLDVSATTLIDGICEDCMLSFKFKTSESAKNCFVCGCSVSNAQCIAGKPIKGTWEAMFAGLPRGRTLRLVFNTPEKP